MHLIVEFFEFEVPKFAKALGPWTVATQSVATFLGVELMFVKVFGMISLLSSHLLALPSHSFGSCFNAGTEIANLVSLETAQNSPSTND